MKKSKIGVVALLLILALTVGVFTALGKEAKTVNAEENEREVNFVESDLRNQFLLSGWRLYYDFEIRSREAQTQDMIDAGLNWIMWTYPWEDKNGNKLSEPETLEEWKQLDEFYSEFGLKYMLKYGPWGSQIRLNTYLDWGPQLENCEFLYVEDEPNYVHFDYSSEFVQELIKKMPDKVMSVNLLPSYGVQGDYQKYVQTWVDTAGKENIEYLSFDNYPFRPTGDYEQNFFSDLEVMRKVAYENGKIKTTGFTQTGSWASTRRPNPTEIRWDMNAMLTYGFKGMNHFCWVSPYPDAEDMHNDFPISKEGNKSEYYEDIVDLNWAVRAMGNVLMNYDCSGAYHTDTRAIGVQYFPDNFILMPSKGGDLIISYLESKDGSEDQIMIFNKSLHNNYKDKIIINGLANVEGIKKFRHTQARTVEHTYDDVDISRGLFDISLAPGEVALYKLMGDNVMLPGALAVPEISLASGAYEGDVYVQIDVPKGMEIYYTTDGSYPTNESVRYDGAILLKAEEAIKNYNFRFIAYQGLAYSKAEDREYIILPGSSNKALYKNVTSDKTFLAYKREGDAVLSMLTDSKCDKAIATPFGTYGSVVVDLAEAVPVEKIVLDIYGDNEPDVLAVDVSVSPDFRTFETVYRLDPRNITGLGGNVGSLQKNSDGKLVISATDLSGKYRYVRVYDRYDVRSVFTEIEVYNRMTSAQSTAIAFDAADWEVESGTWAFDSTAVEKTDSFSLSKDEKEGILGYKANEFSDFIAEADFTISDPGKHNYGAVGFKVGSRNGKPVLAGVRADGKGVVFGEDTEYVAAKSQAPALVADTAYRIRVISVGSMVQVYVNGLMAINVTDDELRLETGDFGVWGSVLPIKAENLSITHTQYEDRPLERNVERCEPITGIIEVAQYTEASQVEKRLPDKIKVYDNTDSPIDASLKWDMSVFDGSVSGYCPLTAALVLPDGLANRHNITVSLNVFVCYNLNKFEIKDLLARAKALTRSDYTSSTYSALQIAISNAETVLKQTSITQNDLGVSVMNIDNAMRHLEYTDTVKSQVDALIMKFSDINIAEYFDSSIKDAFVVALAEWNELVDLKANLKTLNIKAERLDALKEMLVTNEAMNSLRAKVNSAQSKENASDRAKAALASARAVGESRYASAELVWQAIELLNAYFGN